MTENLLSNGFVTENVKRLTENVHKAAVAANRNPDEVQLMAVTKTVDPVYVNEAIAAGIRLLGENRAQELLAKYDAYDKENCQIHFIGHLQSNKVKQIIDKVSMIESVNSLKLAQEINSQAAKHGIVMDTLIEINIGEEESKSGILIADLPQLCEEIVKMENIRLRGFMAIPPFDCDDYQTEKYFSQMYQLFVDMKNKKIDNICMDYLSMGMSHDYELAIKHGANIVRVGTAMFGKRNYKEQVSK